MLGKPAAPARMPKGSRGSQEEEGGPCGIGGPGLCSLPEGAGAALGFCSRGGLHLPYSNVLSVTALRVSPMRTAVECLGCLFLRRPHRSWEVIKRLKGFGILGNLTLKKKKKRRAGISI